MEDKVDKNRVTRILKIAQIFFYIIISVCTLYSLVLNLKQSKLIFKPVVGVVDAKITKMLNGKEDTFENVMLVLLKFGVENVGTLPAKDVIINSSGKIGNTFLPREDYEDMEGIILIPHAKVWNTAKIEKNTIKRLIEYNEKLIFSVKLSYADLEGYEKYNYTHYFEILVNQINPLQLSVNFLKATL